MFNLNFWKLDPSCPFVLGIPKKWNHTKHGPKYSHGETNWQFDLFKRSSNYLKTISPSTWGVNKVLTRFNILLILTTKNETTSYWLVVNLPLWKYLSVGVTIPNIWEKCSKPPTRLNRCVNKHRCFSANHIGDSHGFANTHWIVDQHKSDWMVTVKTNH